MAIDTKWKRGWIICDGTRKGARVAIQVAYISAVICDPDGTADVFLNGTDTQIRVDNDVVDVLDAIGAA